MKILETFSYFIDFQYICIGKQKYAPSMNKDKQIISELRNFLRKVL